MDGKDAGDMRSAAQCRAGILVCHDGTLREDEQLCVRKAVMGLRAVFPFARVLNVGCGRWGGAMSDALPKGTENEEGRCNASRILRRMYAARKAEPGAWAAVLFTGRDLYLPRQSWCFGAASYRQRVTVQSLVRYRDLSAAERELCVRRTLRHELGHVFGMAADRARPGVVDDRGLHCTSPGCSMRQTGKLRDLLVCAAEEERSGELFCPLCRADLARTLGELSGCSR